jgi:hypothetical protein
MMRVGLPIVPGLFFKARSCRFGLSLFILSIAQGINNKTALPHEEGPKMGQKR